MTLQKVTKKVIRAHLAATFVITCITAWFSYACFHADEYFQTIELARWKLWPEQVALLPWEHGARIRPWLQPLFYWVIARVMGVFGVRDIWDLGFVFRLVTGIVSVAAMWTFLRTTLPWQKTENQKLLHLRVVTLAGFLPYLYVRTSSETSSMAALTTGFSILLAGAEEKENGRWALGVIDRLRAVLLSGFLFGIAFELRFQTAFIPIALLAWIFLFVDADRAKKLRASGAFVVGGVLALGVGALADRWGFGEWEFPAWRYFRVNVLEGVANTFGADWPFAYLWLVPANVFLPALAVLLVLALLAWARCPRHPITWATSPFFLVHNVIVHKEERFVFPMALLSTAFVAMALSPRRSRFVRLDEIAKWIDAQRSRWPGRVVVVTSFLMMALLAFFPLGWHQHARFVKDLRERFGDDLDQRVSALPEIDLHYPTYHPSVWDVDNVDPKDLERRIQDGTARPWLITDHAEMKTGNETVDTKSTLVYSELPLWSDPAWRMRLVRWVDWYNANVQHPLRPLRFRSLYRVESSRSPSSSSETTTGK